MATKRHAKASYIVVGIEALSVEAWPDLTRSVRVGWRGASAVLVESAIVDSAARNFGSGGGAYAYDQANLTLRGSRVERCRALYGGAVNAYSSCHVDILEGSVLSECHAASYSGGLPRQSVTRSRHRQALFLESERRFCIFPREPIQCGRGQRQRGRGG